MQHSLSFPPVGFQPTSCTLGGIPAPADEHPENPVAPLTAAQLTPTLDAGLGAWITAPVETTMRDIDDTSSAAENAQVPFLAAQMVVSDYRPQAYGRRTSLWINYGLTTGTVTPAKARQVVQEMRDFAERLEALCDVAEESAASDFEGDPEVARLDREAADARIKAITARHR